MLRSFRLANHRSFLDEQELLLMPSVPGRDHEVLTVAAVYGANASGKSNLLDGLRFMSLAVRHSFQRWDADGGVPRKSFRLDPKARLQPSTFVVEIVDDVPYTYGFSVDDEEVVEEWLYSYPEKRKRILFERERSELKFGTTVTRLKSKLEVLEELTRPNALFLSLAAQSNLVPLLAVHRWFGQSLKFRFASAIVPRAISHRVGGQLNKDALFRKRMVSLLAAADTGIVDLYVEEIPDPHAPRRLEYLRSLTPASEQDAARLQREIDYLSSEPTTSELRFVHGDAIEPFGIEDESAGTRNWLDLLPSVLGALDMGSTLVVDEIDASLHPLLTVRLLELFSSAETNPQRAQLIFTTHDTTPLGSYVGREVLQRDQVWFVEKDSSGQSRLYPLTDFKPRIGENTEKRYLGGSYGAIPVLSDFDPDESVRNA